LKSEVPSDCSVSFFARPTNINERTTFDVDDDKTMSRCTGFFSFCMESFVPFKGEIKFELATRAHTSGVQLLRSHFRGKGVS
jgi:hypothetical protein